MHIYLITTYKYVINAKTRQINNSKNTFNKAKRIINNYSK